MCTEWCCARCQQPGLTMVLGAVLARGRDVFRRNGLLILSVLSVTVGCLLGFFLRTRRLSPQEISYFQFPGELLMRMLKMLILPLVVSSLISGLASLDAKTSGRLGILTVAYYLWTTFVAVIVGIIMVSIIHPGRAAQKEATEQSGKPIMSSADALLDLIRNMFPANLVEATFKQYRTKTTPVIESPKVASEEAPPRRVLIYGVREENGSHIQNFALDLTPPPEVIYKSEPGTSDGMNVLGIVMFSATMGIMLGRMGDSGAPLVSFCQCLNESVMKIVAVAVWYFPFGIVFLIAGKILEMDDPTAVGKKLGFYAVTVVCGLVVHGLFILPLLYFFITKKNPIVFIRGVLQALLIALATSSRAPPACSPPRRAGHPEALTILEEDGGQAPASLPAAPPHCPSPSSACWRTTTSTGASPALCCPWAPPSTWTARRSTRLWPPSSSPRSTTTSWTSVRSSPSASQPQQPALGQPASPRPGSSPWSLCSPPWDCPLTTSPSSSQSTGLWTASAP
ncbi:excitatory amino acid transporter 5 isoform X3 [Phyllostomus discolor]|uniref:Amino acid transporter n=1 Tax=Phyllostomus discolor TaxID=89673 RepID=A0A7E6DT69_9CHIR|nr:excitatory amino acid transporter 5 isoform X3 [Phyllostomus discolor]